MYVRGQLCRVLGRAANASIYIAELAFYHPEWVFHFRPYLCFGLFNLAFGCVKRAAFAQVLVSAASRSDLPDHGSPFMLWSLLNTSVAASAQMTLSAPCSSCAVNVMHQVRLSIRTDMGFHTEIVLVPLLRLMHLWIALIFIVLGRTAQDAATPKRTCSGQASQG